ncbi:hypothetical protein [Streptomyces gobiensis]|uniref:hypothetical protein n=1 Tax=Streptomyces gobiensis TaxID=2875706 RepID=UPI001E30A3DA|nr:hypothetical protein [Streptomyces gobiensis]UGY91911.1 hypothetical protein test1122_09385 [Streptomyces gobiensis]
MTCTRPLLRTVAAVIGLLLLASCGAGTEAETSQIRPNPPSTMLGQLNIEGVVLVTSPDGGWPVSVFAGISNRGTRDDTLTGVRLGSPGVPAKLTPGKGEMANPDASPGPEIPAGGIVLLGAPGATTAIVRAPGRAPQVGEVHPVVFEFRRSGRVSLDVEVVRGTGEYATYAPEGAKGG